MATPAVRSATAPAIAPLPAAPVTGSRDCRGVVLGVGVGTDGVADGVGADGVGVGDADGVELGSGVGAGLGVVLGVGVGTDGVADGVGADGVGVGVGAGVGLVDGVGLGVGVTDGLGSGVGVGVGVTDGVGVGVGSGVGVGVGVGLVSNPALPPDSRLVTLALTSQDWSWETILAVSVHGPGSVESTRTFN